MAGGESGSSSQGEPSDATQQERQQRINALREMSRQAEPPSALPTPATTPGDGGSRPRYNNWRLVVLIGLIALVIAGGATGYLLISRSGSSANGQTKPAAVHAIDLSASKLYCPQAPVWSLDGRQIAIIALDVRCIEQNDTATPDQFVGIFDATTGKMQRIIALKDVLAQHQLVGEANAIAWSSDGKTLAAFGLSHPTSTIGVSQPALILYSISSQQTAPRVIIASPQRDPYRTQVWDVDASTAGPVIADALAPALTYRWTVDGHIAAGQPIPSNPTGVTGRSASDGSFTFWQTGYLGAWSIINGHYTNSHTTDVGVVAPTGVFFSASPVLWSPDGRYVVSGASIGGPVSFSTPPTSALTCPSPDQRQNIPCPPQALPQPDLAFATVITATLKGETITFTPSGGNPTTISDWPVVPVAWSPNGKYLLTILPGNEEYQGAKKLTVTIFDVATGNAVKQFQQDVPPGNASCYGGSPSWSPTGARIALAQCSSDSIILWNSGDLRA